MIIRKSSEIYLDSNATTPVLPAAAQAAQAAMEQVYGNPSSAHVSGLKAREILESARNLCRQVLGAVDGQIVFTSGATEAIQMGVFSTLCSIRNQRKKNGQPESPRSLLYAATEHKAVPQAIRHWNELLGIDNQVLEIPVDQNGQVDLEFIRQHAAQADLVCTMAVNNETGVVAPLAAIEAAIRETNQDARWLVDCVQSVGKMPIQLSETTIDYATLSGHKIYAPKGIGVLYVREGTPLVPLLAGGGQEQGARGGTENLPGVAAIAAVLEQLAQSPARSFADDAQLTQYNQQLKTALKSAFPSIVFNSPETSCVPTTINFSVEGFLNKELLDLFDAAGIRVSSGSACSSKVVGSFVLDAMGLAQWRSEGAIRLSFGPMVSEAEINAACERIQEAGKALCQACLQMNPSEMDYASETLDGLVQLKNGSNCTWLLMDAQSNHCIIVDPFEEMSTRVEALVRCQESKVVAVLDSHAHVDHDSCRGELIDSLKPWLQTEALTNDELGWPEHVAGTVTLDDDTKVPYLKFSKRYIIAQVELPGHTQVGRAYLIGAPPADGRLKKEQIEFAFTGDMILMGGIGRTDFPCSNVEAMYASLRRLTEIIGPHTVLCPTHDYNNELATSLAAERARNSFLNSIVETQNPISLSEFLDTKPGVDAKIDDASNSELVCGLISEGDDCESALEIARGELKAFFQENAAAWIIDVREPHEFSFAQDWSEIGFRSPPQNVPLTRLVGFLPQLRQQVQANPQDVIFLCRSGRRSGVAASVARAMGVSTARHVAGGIALNVATKCLTDEWAEPGYMI